MWELFKGPRRMQKGGKEEQLKTATEIEIGVKSTDNLLYYLGREIQITLVGEQTSDEAVSV